MATNKLLEAAADILTSSKKSAPAMPPEKLDGEVVDLGGPTPQNSKPDDDSNKVHATKAAKSATSPTTKPSAASADTQLRMNKEESEDSAEVIAEEEFDIRDQIQEDINALFADDSTISEDFKSKAATIFEARVLDRVQQIEESIETKYAGMLEEAVEEIKQDLTEKVNDYLGYVVEQWVKENEIAIESGLRSEITEDFIAGLRNLFAEHYIDVPSEKVDLVDELATKVEELEGKLNEEIEYGIHLMKSLVESTKEIVAREVTEGLTATQAEKIKSLAESVEFSTEEEYKTKLETIRENYFPSSLKKAEESQLHETVEEETDKKVSADPLIESVSKAISKTKI
jgi:hypothetical protein